MRSDRRPGNGPPFCWCWPGVKTVSLGAELRYARIVTNGGKQRRRKSAKTVERSSPVPSHLERRHEAYLAKWRAVDWTKTDAELAEEMGLSSGASIGVNRRRIGAPKSLHFHQYRSKFREPYLAKWRNWDWSKQDVALARETGLSRERIRQIRLLIGAPKSPHHKRMPASRRTTIALQWAADNLDRLQGLSGAEVRRKHGFNPHCPAYEFLKAKGVLRDGRLFRKHRWDLMNFELPSSVLERIWKLPFNAAASYRWQKRLGAPKWTLFGGPAARQRRGGLRACNRAVQAEERKAARHFAESETARLARMRRISLAGKTKRPAGAVMGKRGRRCPNELQVTTRTGQRHVAPPPIKRKPDHRDEPNARQGGL